MFSKIKQKQEMSSSVSSVAATIPQNPATFDFKRLDQDCALHTLGFLDTKELGLLNRVVRFKSKALGPANIAIEASCRQRCINEGLPISHAVTYRDLLLKKFPNAIGPGFWREYFGEVEDIPPIPAAFILRAALSGFRLVYIPKHITIDVGANSPLVLDESIAVNGKQARLIQAPEKARKEPRKIKVPITLQNIIFLTQKCLKKNLPSQFAGTSGTWANILNQHDGVGVERSHWSYQKEGPSYPEVPYNSRIENGNRIIGQKELAQEAGLEIVPLLDRIIFEFSLHVKTGRFPQNEYEELTSTVTLGNQGTHWQSAIYWETRGPLFHLKLTISAPGEPRVSVAVGVPDESSQRGSAR